MNLRCLDFPKDSPALTSVSSKRLMGLAPLTTDGVCGFPTLSHSTPSRAGSITFEKLGSTLSAVAIGPLIVRGKVVEAVCP